MYPAYKPLLRIRSHQFVLDELRTAELYNMRYTAEVLRYELKEFDAYNTWLVEDCPVFKNNEHDNQVAS